MTIADVISKADEMRPNAFDNNRKISWLSTVEWDIKRNIVDTHSDSEKVAFNGYDKNTTLDTELIAIEPYSELYVYYLAAQVDYAFGEIGKYNNSMSMYNTLLSDFRNYYNRVHKPLQKNSMKYF